MNIDFKQKGCGSSLNVTELQNGQRIVYLQDFIEAFGTDFEGYECVEVSRSSIDVNGEVTHSVKYRGYLPEINEDYVFYKEFDDGGYFLQYSEYCTLFPINL